MLKKVAIVLSGCGVFDGSEIHETVSTMLALDQAGVTYQCVAPNITQPKVINHFTQQSMNEKRNILIEAARIARGNIKDIKTVNATEFDAAIYPGGFGAACNLSDFAEKGAAMTIQSDVLAFAQAMKKAGKPQGFICIAPTLISKIYGPGIQQTIGNDTSTASAIEKMGGKHMNCVVTKAIVDQKNKVVSTPAYMLAQRISEVFIGVSALVTAVLKLT